jgi:hypothetical protein
MTVYEEGDLGDTDAFATLYKKPEYAKQDRADRCDPIIFSKVF